MRSRVALRYGRVALLVCSVSLTVGAAVAADQLPEAGRSEVRAPAVARIETLPATGHSPRVDETARGEDSARRREAAPLDRRVAPAVPAQSGNGRRVVFDMSAQRVWLVGRGGHPLDSYLVSGSRSDNLAAGEYEVYSRSRHATSFDLRSTMGYMVRFAHGERAAIGFHDIPVDSRGQPLQRLRDLGAPQSHGCIRQRRADARGMWEFADLGTPVVVTA